MEPPTTTPTDAPGDQPFPLPSRSYRDATGHLYHRLSELVFGSLVVAYVLGFVAFVAGLINDPDRPTAGLWDGTWAFAKSFAGGGMFVVYLSISVTFAGLSTGMYVAYHFTVLPRPTVAYERIFLDYTLALLQAIGFGMAMCAPVLFPLLLGIILLIVCARQHVEFVSFADKLYKDGARDRKSAPGQTGKRSTGSPQTAFRRDLNVYLSKQETPIKRWRKTSWQLVGGAVSFVLIGCLLIFLPLPIEQPAHWAVAVGYFVIAIVVFGGSTSTLRYGKIHPSVGPDDLDPQFVELCGIYHVPCERPDDPPKT